MSKRIESVERTPSILLLCPHSKSRLVRMALPEMAIGFGISEDRLLGR